MYNLLKFSLLCLLPIGVYYAIPTVDAQAKVCSTATFGAAVASTITPSDSTVYDPPSRALFVGTEGNLTVRMSATQINVTFSNVGAGSILPICVDRVLSTGTTASNIVILR